GGGGGGGVTRKSSCCDSLCATRASASRRTRYACSFWFTARFAKQPVDVYTENFSPSVLHGVHVLIADNSTTDHEFLTTQMTSSWGMLRQRRKSAPTSSMFSTIRWFKVVLSFLIDSGIGRTNLLQRPDTHLIRLPLEKRATVDDEPYLFAKQNLPDKPQACGSTCLHQ
ncbi:MAG: hypothetical protein WCR46_21130, partial [Deltaproteobacteria bacterium]